MVICKNTKGECFIMQNEVISDAKKRIISFLDEKSFVEFDELVDSGVITGYGTVFGRPVCIFSQDFSVMSGAITYKNSEKICNIIDMAVKNGVPLIGFYDSMGAKIDEGIKVFSGLQNVLVKLANASGVIPEISVVLGTVTGIATFAVNFSDFVFMIENRSKMFINSPQVLTAKTGCDVTAEDIGGTGVHSEKTGSCHFSCKNEDDCFGKLKELLSFLPDNNLADTEVIESDDLNRVCDELLGENVTARCVISSISDENRFFEISSDFGKNIIIGFCRVGGRTVGIVANNFEYNEGKLTILGIEKASKFVRFCDAFNIPIVTLIDNDGFEESVEEELHGAVKSSSRLLFAYADATVPKIDVIFGKAFGGANLMMGTAADVVLAWNSSKISVLEPMSAVNILFSDEIANSESPIEFRNEKLREYLADNALPENAAKDGFISAVISPNETRQRIISALDMFSGKREIRIAKRHESVTF